MLLTQDSKEEIEEIEEHYSEYSLEFDDDNEANRENSLDRSIRNNNSNNNNNNNTSSNNYNNNASSSNNDSSSSSTQRQQQQQGSAAAAFEANAGKEQGSDEQPSPPQSPQPARQRRWGRDLLVVFFLCWRHV